MWDFPIVPERASTIAGDVDLLFYGLIGLSLFFIVAVVLCILYFAVKYRRGSGADRTNPINESLFVESTWVIVPTFLGVGMFAWAAFVFFDMQRPASDADAMEIYGIGKQWMWKFQHPGGQREINTLHVPVGRPVKMVLTSQDVIHSFFVPAFRVKQDALPGRYTRVWFEATKPGTYHLFCTEYCGTEHSLMGGRVHVMEPAAYAAWLETGDTGGSNTAPGTGRYDRTPTGGRADGSEPLDPETWQQGAQRDAAPPPQAMAAAGQQLFQELRCNACHRVDSTALYPATGPALEGVYGHPAELQNNRTLIADEQYLRESILYPQQKLVAGYPPVMPTYKGQISEEELMQLISYIQSLGGDAEGANTGPQTAAPNSQSY